MRISELAGRAGVPVATVKYYLREGLLPAGRLTGATQAQYGEEHLIRLRLIRALVGLCGLSIARVRAVLAVLDEPDVSVHQALGAAHRALPGVSLDESVDLTETRARVQRWGWHVPDDSPALVLLARALEALHAADPCASEALLDRYAQAAGQLGAQDVAEVPTDSLDESVGCVVVHTLLLEPVLIALRRLAQTDASGRRFPDSDHHRDPAQATPPNLDPPSEMADSRGS